MPPTAAFAELVPELTDIPTPRGHTHDMYSENGLADASFSTAIDERGVLNPEQELKDVDDLWDELECLHSRPLRTDQEKLQSSIVFPIPKSRRHASGPIRTRSLQYVPPREGAEPGTPPTRVIAEWAGNTLVEMLILTGREVVIQRNGIARSRGRVDVLRAKRRLEVSQLALSNWPESFRVTEPPPSPED